MSAELRPRIKIISKLSQTEVMEKIKQKIEGWYNLWFIICKLNSVCFRYMQLICLLTA